MVQEIFLNYRPNDRPGMTGRISDQLVMSFGLDAIYNPTIIVPPGADVRVYRRQALQSCVVMLVVIGPAWLRSRANNSASKLADENDPVRTEIVTALGASKQVIPVLLGDTTMPQTENIPYEMGELTNRASLRVRADPDFAPDMGRVIKAIKRYVPWLPRTPRAERLVEVQEAAASATPETREPDGPNSGRPKPVQTMLSQIPPHAAALDFELTQQDEDELITLLLQFPSIADFASRELILNRLDKAIFQNIKRHSALAVEVTHIVKACAAHIGGVGQLRDAVHFHEGDSSRAVQRLDAFLMSLAARGVS